MKKRHLIVVGIALILVIIVVANIISSKNVGEYKGYWCMYEESSNILLKLKDNHTKKDREKIEATIETFESVTSVSYMSKEQYAEDIGGDPNEMDIYATYFISLSTLDSIGTYIEELKKLDGVYEVEQHSAKTNVSLFNIKSWGEYTFTDSDEATTDQLEYGNYKVKKGVITFTPDEKGKQTKILYMKDGYLCGNAACTKIYAKSNSTCQPVE